MFRKGLFKQSYSSFIFISPKRCWSVLIGIWPKVPSLSGSFFPNKFHSKFKFILSQSSRYPDLCSPTQPFEDAVGPSRELSSTVGIGSTLTDRFPTLKYEPSPPTSRVYPCYFTWGATLLPQPWPEHGFIIMQTYRLSCLHRQNCPTWLIAMAKT